MIDGLRIELVNPQRRLLEELTYKGITRDSVALTYAFCIWQKSSDAVDFAVVNAAIRTKWSQAAVNYIKRKAWAYVEERKARENLHDS